MSTPLPSSVDVAVVGAGNAAFCAGLAAAEQGVSVLMLERAPEEEAGGITAGAFCCVYNGVYDLRALIPDLTDEEVSKSDFGTSLKRNSSTTWAASRNTAPTPSCARSWSPAARKRCCGCATRACASCRSGADRPTRSTKFKFWGGLTVEAWGGGPGLVDALTKIARKNNIGIAYGARAGADCRRRRRQGNLR